MSELVQHSPQISLFSDVGGNKKLPASHEGAARKEILRRLF
jgi:hypothetical protein